MGRLGSTLELLSILRHGNGRRRRLPYPNQVSASGIRQSLFESCEERCDGCCTALGHQLHRPTGPYSTLSARVPALPIIGMLGKHMTSCKCGIVIKFALFFPSQRRST